MEGGGRGEEGRGGDLPASIFLSAERDKSVNPQAHRSPMELTREEEAALLSNNQWSNTVMLLLALAMSAISTCDLGKY